MGGQRFNDRKEVKDIHSYMSIVANPRDDVRLRRIINEPARKIGATTIEVIADLAAQQGISMLDVISHADQYAKLSRAIAPLYKFWDIYQKLQESLETKTLDEFAADVIEHELTEEGGKLKFSYTLDSGAENFISRNLVDITVDKLPEA